MKQVRIGIIGLGTMGSVYAKNLQDGLIEGAVLTAVMVRNNDNKKIIKNHLGEEVVVHLDEDSFFTSENIDAVIIATPHQYHPSHAIKAFQQGLHVLCDKPAGIHTKEVEEMNIAAKKSSKVFSMMFNQRTNPHFQKLRDLIKTGELGAIRRINWINTNWYRPQSYYDSKDWRGTWVGEGGGVLINQSLHQLDLWQWITGMMPTRLRAFCQFGKYREIEVEDDVTAYAEYENGATAVFITTTGEAPGTNRLEITGDRGKVVLENEKVEFWRLRVSESQFNQEYKGLFGEPECWKIDVPVVGEDSSHKGIIKNFVEAILKGEPLIAPGEEGIKGLSLSNAMHLSTWTDDWVEFPVDQELYYRYLQAKINGK